jgi:hypothetical protein
VNISSKHFEEMGFFLSPEAWNACHGDATLF